MQAGRLPIWRSAINNPQPLVRVLCIAIAVALIIAELWPTISAQFGKPVTTSSHRTTAVETNAASTEQIASADLFGHAATDNPNLPPTNLAVTLRAVFAASDPKAASAVIESSDGRTQVLKVGATIDSSASLQAVYANRVVLSRNGELETLYFPAPQESTAMTVPQDSEQPISTNAGDPNAPTTASSAEEIKRAAIMQRLEELRARTPR